MRPVARNPAETLEVGSLSHYLRLVVDILSVVITGFLLTTNSSDGLWGVKLDSIDWPHLFDFGGVYFQITLYIYIIFIEYNHPHCMILQNYPKLEPLHTVTLLEVVVSSPFCVLFFFVWKLFRMTVLAVLFFTPCPQKTVRFFVSKAVSDDRFSDDNFEQLGF